MTGQSSRTFMRRLMSGSSRSWCPSCGRPSDWPYGAVVAQRHARNGHWYAVPWRPWYVPPFSALATHHTAGKRTKLDRSWIVESVAVGSWEARHGIDQIATCPDPFHAPTPERVQMSPLGWAMLDDDTRALLKVRAAERNTRSRARQGKASR